MESKKQAWSKLHALSGEDTMLPSLSPTHADGQRKQHPAPGEIGAPQGSASSVHFGGRFTSAGVFMVIPNSTIRKLTYLLE